MRVILACEHNVARSYCAQRVLSPLYPELQIVSAGTNISEQKFEYPWRNAYLAELGITDDNASPTSILKYIEEQKPNDLIIASDRTVYEEIEPNITDFSKFHSLDNFGIQEWAMPKNPKNLPRYEMTVATTMALISYRFGIEKIFGKQSNSKKIKVVYWKKTPTQEEMIDTIKYEVRSGRNAISLHPIDVTGIELGLIEPFDTLDTISLGAIPKIYVPKYEDLYLSRRLITPLFAKKMIDLSEYALDLTFLAGPIIFEDSINKTNLFAGMISQYWEVM